MSSEVDLFRSLDDEPQNPSTVDVRRAIATARRRRRRRHAAGYAGAAAVTALAVAGTSVMGGLPGDRSSPTPFATGKPAPSKPAETERPTTGSPIPLPPTTCTLSRLAAPGNAPMALVSGADPSARLIVGRSYPKAGGYQAVIWTNGKGREVNIPGDLEESLQDINSAGTAVGWSYDDNGPVPYAFLDGKAKKLAGVRNGSALGINEAGAIVGDDDGKSALLWPSVTAKPTRLPVPAGATEARARAIDEDGTIVGNVGAREEERPYVWFADGTHRELPMPQIDGEPAVRAQAYDIRGGWVTGMAGVAGAGKANAEAGEPNAEAGKPNAESAGPLAVRWNLSTGAVELIGGLQFPADAVNRQGWQVGTDQKGYAVLIAGKSTVRLPDLGKHRADGTATIPSTLSDDGRTIAGQSDDETGTIQAVIWKCK